MSTGTATQKNRPLSVTTPLGGDTLLLIGCSGTEAISHLFTFNLHLVTANKNRDKIEFDKLLGGKVTAKIELAGKGSSKYRYLSGICSSFSEGGCDLDYTSYHLEMVPKLWLLTNTAQSRIFQQKSVKDILRDVFKDKDIDVDDSKLKGQYEKRDYCVQYRETDFNFVSRLMEEEGIFYYFEHSSDNHKLILADSPTGHSNMPEKSSVIFDPGEGGQFNMEGCVYEWEKTQTLRSGKYTLRDYCFEKPDDKFEATEPIKGEVKAGTKSHKLKVGGNDKLEIYDSPGEYAQRFDGIDPGGGEQSDEVSKISNDKSRTVKIRMGEEAVQSMLMHGASGCRQWTSGYKFKLDRHFNANGEYVVTSVNHSAHQPVQKSGQDSAFRYHNSFTCIPSELAFRPPRVTPKPVIHSTQTAVVVGPSGEEIFTDKYGRVKVQFHWDRQGKNDGKSSCWVRVGSIWAGKQWGGVHIPRVGQEVIVAFEEGDPDQPIIIGSVYNADQMPPYKLPDHKTVSGLQSRSTLKGESAHFNELRFEDKKDSEYVYFHAQKNFHRFVEHDDNLSVSNDRKHKVYRDQHIYIKRNQIEQIGGNLQLTVGHGDSDAGDDPGKFDVVVAGNKSELIEKDNEFHVKGNRNEKIDGNTSLTVGGSQQEKVGQTHALEAGQVIHIKGGQSVIIEAGMQLSLVVGGNFVTIDASGVAIQGTMVMINSGGAAGSGPGSSPTAPQDAQQAQPQDPHMPSTRLGT